MSDVRQIKILVVEDSSSDLKIIEELFSDSGDVEFSIEQSNRLSDAISLLETSSYDAILLDLGLPDSQGVNTFIELHSVAPEVPVLILSGNEDPNTGLNAIRSGAEDYLAKKTIQSKLLQNSVKYAIARNQVRKEKDAEEKHQANEREMQEIHRLSTPPPTTITARIYSGSPLKESAPNEFNAALAEYLDVLDLALENRAFKMDTNLPERFRELGLQLGFMRSGPRDVIEIHTNALKKRIQGVPPLKAAAYLEEGRICVLELMGYLTSYYRNFYTATQRRETQT